MDLKDLRKWVDDFGLVFKVRYGGKMGCEVKVFYPGFVDPIVSVIREDCIAAFADIDFVLWRRFGGEEHVSEEHI